MCLERARLDILVAGFAGAEDLNPTYLFIATWYQVVEFGGSSSQVQNDCYSSYITQYITLVIHYNYYYASSNWQGTIYSHVL